MIGSIFQHMFLYILYNRFAAQFLGTNFWHKFSGANIWHEFLVQSFAQIPGANFWHDLLAQMFEAKFHGENFGPSVLQHNLFARIVGAKF